jgi:hypothetical protein
MRGLGLPRAESPEQVGLSSARLERLAGVIRADVERQLIPGAVLTIARAGRVGYAEAFGWRDREAGVPDDGGCDLPGRLDDQADHLGRGNDAGRGGAARNRRAGRGIHT